MIPSYFITGSASALPVFLCGDEGNSITSSSSKRQTVLPVTKYIWGSNGLAGVSQGLRKLLLLYDAEGSPIGFLMNGIAYTYVKNIQGDIIKILDNTGAAVVSYTYDPWGVPTATGNTIIAEINPCTYRGYDYDEDTGCFYLQSRYYSPSSGRFLCVDAPEMVGMSVLDNHITGANLFSYCNNCPTCASDPTGYYNISYEASWLLNVLFSSIFMLKASGAALLAKVSALIASVAPYLVAVAAVVAVVVISYFSAKKIAVEKAHAKILKTVKKGSSSLYWSASLGWNCVDIGRPLKYAVALSYVKSGKSVFTTTKELAYALAKAAGNGREPTRPEHHGKAKNQPGYYWHYHAYGHKKAHIWYLF